MIIMIMGLSVVNATLSINNTLPTDYDQYDINLRDYVSCVDSTSCNVTLESTTTDIISAYQLLDYTSQGFTGASSNPWAITFNNNGSKMYISNPGVPGLIYQYNLTTAFDPSTKVSDGTFSVTSQDNTPNGIYWKDDGTKFYMLGNDLDDIFEYTVSSAYDVTSASFSTSTPVAGTSVSGLYFTSDGTKFFYVDDGSNRFYEYGMSSAWDVSTATQTSFLSTQDTNPSDVKFAPDGLKMFLLGRSGDDVYQYSLTSAFNLSTATYDSISLSVVGASPSGFYFNNDGTEFYLIENNNNRVYTYALTSSEYTFTSTGNKTYLIEAGNSTDTINTSGYIYVNPDITFSLQLSNGTAITDFTFGGKTDVAGTVTFETLGDGLVIGSNNLSFEKDGFIAQNFTVSITGTELQSFTFNVTPSQIVINIFDKVTGSVLTQNISLQLIGPLGATGSTTTGSLTFDTIDGIPGDYQIIATNVDYETETVYFTYTAQENATQNIYMINSSNPDLGIVTIQVKDSLSFLVESATVSLLEWKPSLSSYITVGQCQTLTSGTCNLNIELNNKLYKFSATKFSTTKTTNSQIIATTDQTIILTLEDVVLTETQDLENVLSNMTETIVGNVSTTRLQWADTNGVVSRACITTYKNTGFNQVLLGQNCTSSSSGILFVTNQINNSFAILIKGSIDYSGTTYPIGQFFHDSVDSISASLENFGLDIFIPTIFLMLAVAAGIFWGNIYISLSLAIILEWFATILAPSVISTSIAIIVTVICGLIFWGVSRK